MLIGRSGGRPERAVAQAGPLEPAVERLPERAQLVAPGRQDQPAAWAQHSPKLRQGVTRRRQVVERQRERQQVDAGVAERQVFEVALDQARRAGVLPGGAQHRGGEVHGDAPGRDAGHHPTVVGQGRHQPGPGGEIEVEVVGVRAGQRQDAPADRHERRHDELLVARRRDVVGIAHAALDRPTPTRPAQAGGSTPFAHGGGWGVGSRLTSSRGAGPSKARTRSSQVAARSSVGSSRCRPTSWAANGSPAVADAARQADRRQAEQRPRRLERRIAGRLGAGRLVRGGRQQEGVDVGEQRGRLGGEAPAQALGVQVRPGRHRPARASPRPGCAGCTPSGRARSRSRGRRRPRHCIVMPWTARYRSTGDGSLTSRTVAPAALAFAATS